MTTATAPAPTPAQDNLPICESCDQPYDPEDGGPCVHERVLCHHCAPANCSQCAADRHDDLGL